MLRYRGPSKKTIESVKRLDVFPKVPESYVETSAQGATLSILTFLLIMFLVISEIIYFFDTRFDYDYKVDVEFDTKVWLNFDITVATPCGLIGADVVDVTGQASLYDEVIEENVNFDQTSDEFIKRQQLLAIKHKLTSYEDGNKLNEIVLKHGYNTTKLFPTHISKAVAGRPNACRYHGSLPLTKVAGNFHIVSGKPLAIMGGGHAHLSFALTPMQYNFSHRIDHFSFGDKNIGLINALDGDERVSHSTNDIFQYYLDIVSTKIKTRRMKADAYQFSVSELSREVDHSSGSHGMPGIFFKYDFSPVSVIINEHTMPLGRFLVRLCGIVGGIFATSCIVNGLANFFKSMFKNMKSKEVLKSKDSPLVAPDSVNAVTNGLQPKQFSPAEHISLAQPN